MRFVYILVLLLLSCKGISCELNVRLEQYAPESYKNIENNWFGIDMELTQALLSEANCQFKVHELSWGRALVMLAKGDIDMVLNMSKTPQRETIFHFIGPIRQEEIVLATKKGVDLNLTNIEDLAHLKKPIAVQRNAYYGKHVQNLIKNKNYAHMFIFVTDNQTKIEQLNKGRIIGFLEAKRNIINGISNNNTFQNITYQPLAVHTNPVFFAFSKASINGPLFYRLQLAFEQLIEKGIIAKIDS